MYATFEMAKIRQRQTLEAAAQIPPSPAQHDLLSLLGTLLIKAGRRLQARHQYGTVLHAG
ncbi:MAG: hypothetical protein H8E28_15745 [Anaerolineae bacterium]|nr:hypothetical protein [Anaerolineae bacterium]MBL6966252.1 hypothetical protein [Anaerolineales bacterium]